MKAKFNINENVTVVLTDTGAAVLNEWNSSIKHAVKNIKLDYKKGDVITRQMWSIMSIFGPSLMLGASIPFETDIELNNILPL